MKSENRFLSFWAPRVDFLEQERGCTGVFPVLNGVFFSLITLSRVNMCTGRKRTSQTPCVLNIQKGQQSLAMWIWIPCCEDNCCEDVEIVLVETWGWLSVLEMSTAGWLMGMPALRTLAPHLRGWRPWEMQVHQRAECGGPGVNRDTMWWWAVIAADSEEKPSWGGGSPPRAGLSFSWRASHVLQRYHLNNIVC